MNKYDINRTYRVAGVQMYVKSIIEENLATIISFIGKASGAGADFVLFPEMSITGSSGDFDQKECENALGKIAEACRRGHICAIVGTRYKDAEGCYIQSRIYSKDGLLIGTHEKMVPTISNRKWCLPGKVLRTFEVDRLCFGCLICNDLWVTPGCGPYADPRLTYQLAQKGAKLIFHSVKTGSDPFYQTYHESNLLLRAREGNIYIAVANVAEDKEVNARSGIVAPDGHWLIQSDTRGEQFYTADITINSSNHDFKLGM